MYKYCWGHFDNELRPVNDVFGGMIMQEYANDIKTNSDFFHAREYCNSAVDRLHESLLKKIRETEETAEMIRAAYRMPEGSPARTWAELMLQSLEGEGKDRS